MCPYHKHSNYQISYWPHITPPPISRFASLSTLPNKTSKIAILRHLIILIPPPKDCILSSSASALLPPYPNPGSQIYPRFFDELHSHCQAVNSLFPLIAMVFRESNSRESKLEFREMMNCGVRHVESVDAWNLVRFDVDWGREKARGKERRMKGTVIRVVQSSINKYRERSFKFFVVVWFY
jgi:hypothetical protein